MVNQIKTILLLGLLSAMLIAIGFALGPVWLIGLSIVAIAINVGSYYFSDRIILAMHGAKEVAREEFPVLHRIVDDVSQRAGIPKPRVCLIQGSYANAFATGRNPEKGVVAVTEGLLRVLSGRELRGVIAHEIAHIRNRDILIASVAATLTAAIGYVAHGLQFTAFFNLSNSDDKERSSPWNCLMFAFYAPLGATLVQLGISRSREYVADTIAAEITGDPEGLARALEKLSLASGQTSRVEPELSLATASLFIVNPMIGRGAVSWFSTHPPTQDRIRRLRTNDGLIQVLYEPHTTLPSVRS
ncbi:hypothetical protein ETAA8_43990 [Anatilimnocola aggregata]|uniref:Protease HtpX homolog n=1 Tax=Anatilimnocola aggregata TaxID=2528021 RepID=A0A517YGF7_9BACT|nr:zinc metalloprotease HtpX [Anatilimnocola aggregata]QDU29291.1 hypothetical protein ETAA8_43990 [Anatilimnocola aggregata]